MKAIRVHAWNKPPVPEHVPGPQVQPGRTLVGIYAASVGHIDRSVMSGRFFRSPGLPYTPGTEGAGVVLEGGSYPPGTRVWVRGRGLGTTIDGTWSEVVSAPDEALGELPDDVPMELGACFFSSCTAAWVGLNDVARLRPGERVAISGVTGAVGSVAAQLALRTGAEVFGLVADAAGSKGLPAGVQALTDDSLAAAECSVLLDTIGGPGLGPRLAALASGARAVLVGYTAGNACEVDIARLIQRDVAVLPLNMLEREPAARAAAPELLRMLGAGEITMRIECFPLEGAALALEWITQRQHRARAVLVSDSNPRS